MSAINGLFDRLVRWSVPIGVGLTAGAASIYNVDGGQRAIIFDRLKGVRSEVIGEGMHFLVPWLHRAILFDIRTRPRTITTTTGSKDMQTVSLTLRVLHRPDPAALPAIYSRLGTDYEERVLPSIGNEVLKATVAQYDASELITQRELVSAQVRNELLKRAAEFHIVLEDVALTHLNFSKEFTKAVEEKQVAQQEAERAKYVVEKVEQEKQAAIIRAQGEEHAARIITSALESCGTGMLELRRIEAAREIAGTLASANNVTYLPGGQPIMMTMPGLSR